MARQGISKEQVFEAAAALLEEGAAPTVQAVRDRLGSGSFSTINSHLAEWRREHADQAPANIPDIPEKVQAAFNQLWATAARTAREDVETQRQALEAMRREMDKERADMAAEIKHLEKSLEEAQGTIGKLETGLAEERQGRLAAERQVTDIRIENARLDERAKATEKRAGELKDQLEGLQVQFAEAVKQKTRVEKRVRKPPAPKEP